MSDSLEIINYASIAIPVVGGAILSLGCCFCCAWRRIDRRLTRFEEILNEQHAATRIYNPPQHSYPTAPPPYSGSSGYYPQSI